MVSLVVDDEDALQAHQRRHHPAQHLPLRLHGAGRLAAAPEQRARSLRQFQPLAPLERVVVRDDHARPLHVRQHVARNEFAAAVVAVRVFRQQNPEAVPDRDSRRYDQETAREVPAAGTADRVHGLPGDQHGHDHRLAGPGRHFEGDAEEFGVCGGVRAVEVVPDFPSAPR